MSVRRKDRYCTSDNAPAVFEYMCRHSQDMAKLFRIPGFHRAQFYKELSDLSLAPPNQLSSLLTELCLKFDRSEKEKFGDYKTRIRQFIYRNKKTTNIVISESNYNSMMIIKDKEQFSSIDEVMAEMIALWRFENKY